MPPPSESDQIRSSSVTASSDRIQIATLSLLALTQAALLVWSGSGITRVVAVVLAVAGLSARLRALWVLAALILVNFGIHIWLVGTPVPLREVHVAVPILYGAAAGAALVGFFAGIRFRTTFFVLLVPALALIAVEAAAPFVVPPLVLGMRPRWFDAATGAAVPDDMQEPYAFVRQTYPGNPRGYFQPPSNAGARGPAARPGVEYELNAFGCRGRDLPVPNPHERQRVLVLGGAGAFGRGVREADTLAVRLSSALADPKAGAGIGPAEVINCGLSGSSTADQRAFYERIGSKYEPAVVLLVMGDRDNLSTADERQRGFVHQGGRLEGLSIVARMVQWGRHEGRRPFEYDGVAEEVVKLEESVRSRGSRLAVVVLRVGELEGRWGALVGAVSAKLQGRNTPFEDLGLTLLRSHTPRDLEVHPTDGSPNEIAHREAADQVARLLRSQELLH